MTGVLRLYGAELFGFIAAMIEVPALARDVYVAVGVQLSCGLRAFEWTCDLRTWIYALTRRELAAFREKNGSPTYVSMSSPPPKPPSSGPFRQKAFRGLIAGLRKQLAPEERELLILRVDRRLSWRSLAISSLGVTANEGDLMTEETRLRRALARLKEKLAQIAQEQGILAAR